MAIEGKDDGAPARRLRLGMVGGGRGAFIGAVHRLAARMDDRYELVAGALASDPERAKASAADLRIAPDRAYGSYQEMAEREAAREDGIDAVSIVTPNHMHHSVAKAFLEAGIHVICDKPLTTTVEDSLDLVQAVRNSGLVFGLTHNYTGYPMVRHARAMVRAGELGAVRLVQVEYPQDWLTTRLEETGAKQAVWRTDPRQAGPVGSLGDLGTHAHNLARFITGLEVSEVCADLTTFVQGRQLEDNAHVLLRFENGARGMLWSSQVAPGNENALRIRVYGEKAGLTFEQENPNQLWVTPLGEPPRLIRRAGAGAGKEAGRVSRIPPGHPEGYLEGFANIYGDLAEVIAARLENREADPAALDYPKVEDGALGVRFVAAAVESSRKGGAWVDARLDL